MRIMPSAQEKPIIRVAPNNPVFDLPVIVAIEEGLFEAAGLDVRFSATWRLSLIPHARLRASGPCCEGCPRCSVGRSRDGTNAHPGTLVPSAVTETQNMYLIPNWKIRGVPAWVVIWPKLPASKLAVLALPPPPSGGPGFPQLK